MPDRPLLILVDGSSYLFRAYYALPPLMNTHNEPTGAMYGVLNMLKKLAQTYTTPYIAVVFDTKAKTFRHEQFPEYKANRLVMPDDLGVQIAPLHQMIQAQGFPLLTHEGVEADDVIATLTVQAVERGFDVLISTGDKDLSQLVNHHVKLINTMTNTELDSEGVRAKFGVPPAQMIDYLSLIGDTADNIPGIPLVGPKTAAKWLQTYGSLDGLLAAAPTLTGKAAENLRQYQDRLIMARQLITVKTDVPLSEKPDQLQRRTPDIATLREAYTRYAFKNWLKEINELPAETNTLTLSDTQAATVTYTTIFTESELDHWLSRVQHATHFAFDTETTSLNPIDATLVGISMAIEMHAAVYIPVAHDYEGAPQQLSRETVLAKLQPIFDNPQLTMIGQNLKYDLEILMQYGITVKNTLRDTMLAAYVLDSTQGRYDMDTLANRVLQRNTITYESIAKQGSTWKTFNEIDIETATRYSAEDAEITFALDAMLYPELQHTGKLAHVFETLEMPLVPILAQMEHHGLLLDPQVLKQQSAKLQTEIAELEQTIYREAGCLFNLASPKQLQEVLYTQMGLPIFKKTPSGQPSTAEEVLSDLAVQFPIAAHILAHRTAAKLKSTYTDALPLAIHPKTQRVHTSFNQAVTSTGRLSSHNPNVQNIPIRTEAGRAIRQAFIAPPGCVLLSADYSQVELRIMAHVSADQGLIQAFQQGQDIHRTTAAEVFGVPLEQVSADQRRHAKAINFGLIYGMSSFGLSRQLGIAPREAQAYIDRYFERYPGVHRYMEDTRKLAAAQGYVETLFGRRMLVPNIHAKNPILRKGAERAAINAPLQGSAADLIKHAMIDVSHYTATTGGAVTLILQVHDELVFEIAESVVDTAQAAIQHAMESAVTLRVPLLVDIEIGANWGDVLKKTQGLWSKHENIPDIRTLRDEWDRR
ncbi:MAG: DNA polymerase I [Gammaproteobacteria bacterium RIFCSPHIGHO2_12_FULL_45_9]|nr:MAG: DNA polymerase I [Gammaproteobacteria bacterium RIFCSPHIGHO2_12_FULL_45_9]